MHLLATRKRSVLARLVLIAGLIATPRYRLPPQRRKPIHNRRNSADACRPKRISTGIWHSSRARIG